MQQIIRIIEKRIYLTLKILSSCPKKISWRYKYDSKILDIKLYFASFVNQPVFSFANYQLLIKEKQMDFFDLITKRYSVRAYQSKLIEEDKLQKILEAANLAPTAANRQPFKIIVIHTKGKDADLKRIYHRDWFSQAPLVIGICAAKSEAWSRMDGKNYADVDATIAMDHLILAAANLGLGTCWIAAFDPDAAREVLGLPVDVEPVAFTPLGYPADEWKPKKRKSLEEVVRYERW